MAHLHQHAGQKHINFGSIGQKIKMFGEVAASMKGIVETGLYLKNTLGPVVAGVAALAI
jgi:hypothetical protein